MKRRILYIILGILLLSNITFGQESFNLNSGASTASNDGNFCGRVKFDVVNSNSFAVDVDIMQKVPGSGTYVSTGITYTISANQTANLNSSFVSTSGSYSYYAIFSKSSDFSKHQEFKVGYKLNLKAITNGIDIDNLIQKKKKKFF